MNKQQIRQQVAVTRNTATITRAMEMVATGKIRKARARQQQMLAYWDGVFGIVGRLASRSSHFSSRYRRFFEPISKTPESSLYIVVGSDRGLCGGLNVQLVRSIQKHYTDLSTKQISALTIGKKATVMMRYMGAEAIGAAPNPETPNMEALSGYSKLVFDGLFEGKFDHVYLAYNRYVSGILQEPTITQFFPVLHRDDSKLDFEYEPSLEALLLPLLRRYFEAGVMDALHENFASEQSARMMAMKSATDNALEMVRQLNMAYHKERQGRITQEISEISAGLGALS